MKKIRIFPFLLLYLPTLLFSCKKEKEEPKEVLASRSIPSREPGNSLSSQSSIEPTVADSSSGETVDNTDEQKAKMGSDDQEKYNMLTGTASNGNRMDANSQSSSLGWILDTRNGVEVAYENKDMLFFNPTDGTYDKYDSGKKQWFWGHWYIGDSLELLAFDVTNFANKIVWKIKLISHERLIIYNLNTQSFLAFNRINYSNPSDSGKYFPGPRANLITSSTKMWKITALEKYNKLTNQFEPGSIPNCFSDNSYRYTANNIAKFDNGTIVCDIKETNLGASFWAFTKSSLHEEGTFMFSPPNADFRISKIFKVISVTDTELVIQRTNNKGLANEETLKYTLIGR